METEMTITKVDDNHDNIIIELNNKKRITLSDDIAEEICEKYENIKYRKSVEEYVKRKNRRYNPDILKDEDLMFQIIEEYKHLDKETRHFASHDNMIEYAIYLYDEKKKYIILKLTD